MALKWVLILEFFKIPAILTAHILIQSHTVLRLILMFPSIIEAESLNHEKRIKVVKLMGAMSFYITGVFNV